MPLHMMSASAFGADSLSGGDGFDLLYGGDGNDLVLVGTLEVSEDSINVYDGGNDSDTIRLTELGDYDFSQDSIVNFEALELNANGNDVTLTGAQVSAGYADLTVAADTQVIFDTPIEQRYERAMALLGLAPWMLSSEVGHS